MRAFFQYCFLPFYRRWALWHIQENRRFRFQGLELRVPVGVFHPGIFFSSPIFLRFLQGFDFQGKRLLDIGTGSGLLALFAAQKGADVCALDIHPLAVETAQANALRNNLKLRVLESDLLDELEAQPFDFVLINPPYYPKKPQNFSEHAFFAGQNLEYFEKLFSQLPRVLKTSAKTYIWMILSEDCALDQISRIAQNHKFLLHSVWEQKKWGERFFVFQADPC